MTTSLSRRQDGAVILVTLARPPINALDQEALDGLSEVIRAADVDPDARVVVFASGIEGVFCSGGDLKYWRGIDDAERVSRAGCEVFSLIERLSKPTIAAIDGHVIGDGLLLALACDLRVASDKATFRVPEVGYGFIPGWGLIHRLAALVGRTNAADMLLTRRQVDAPRGLAIGLVTEVVPSERILDHVLERARELSLCSPAALRAAKCALLGADELECFESVWGKADWREGIGALLARRTPVFGRVETGGAGHDFAGGVQADRIAGRGGSCC